MCLRKFILFNLFSIAISGTTLDFKKMNERKFRLRRNVIADSSNIRVVVGNTQTHPAVEGISIENEKQYYHFESPSASTSKEGDVSSQRINNYSALSNDVNIGVNIQVPTGSSSSNTALNTGNAGGEHHNNIIIGGIHNYGSRSTSDVMKFLLDANNKDGVHQNTVVIGGIIIL